MLVQEELEALSEDFKHFLIVNGVHNEEWEEMNATDKPKAISLVEMFSDTVLQKVYEKIEFLEFRAADSCMVFYFKKDEIELISINAKMNGSVDLSTPESIHEALATKAGQLSIFHTKKRYNSDRESEIHTMFEQGCVTSTKDFWEALTQVLN